MGTPLKTFSCETIPVIPWRRRTGNTDIPSGASSDSSLYAVMSLRSLTRDLRRTTLLLAEGLFHWVTQPIYCPLRQAPIRSPLNVSVAVKCAGPVPPIGNLKPGTLCLVAGSTVLAVLSSDTTRTGPSAPPEKCVACTVILLVSETTPPKIQISGMAVDKALAMPLMAPKQLSKNTVAVGPWSLSFNTFTNGDIQAMSAVRPSWATTFP
mmetsp:Transcript_75948/g.232454  ORF Transcript_75948/g.232454 Transcript_75948/m.232454 type:complete len:209 (-) Transcript_75948:183-809(-)